MAPSVASAPFRRIGVAGLGLMGGSVALGAQAAWPGVEVRGCDEPARLEAARHRQVVSGGGALEALADCDLIVLAVPLAAMDDVLRALGDVHTDAVITDVGSTKRRVMTSAAAAGIHRFVGGHPMAGAERPGLDQARADLFVDRPWLLVEGSADAEAQSRVERFASGLGARTSWMDAEQHDRVVAYVSHLPQVLGAALMATADDGLREDAASAAGPAFTEMTRLASSPPDMWRRVLSENADFVAEALDRFARELPTAADLQSGAWVRDVLGRAGDARQRWRRRPPSS
jgi:prephenate dehydrogenase